MNKILACLLACNLLLLPLAHAGGEVAGARQVVGKNGLTGIIIGEIVGDSRFNLVQIGMQRGEVERLLGPADDLKIIDTGVASMLFNRRQWQTEQVYAGAGRLRFNRTGHLIRIDARWNGRI